MRETLPVTQAGDDAGAAQIGIVWLEVMMLVRARGHEDAAIAQDILYGPEFIDEIAIGVAPGGRVNVVGAGAGMGGVLLLAVDDGVARMQMMATGVRSQRWNS